MAGAYGREGPHVAKLKAQFPAPVGAGDTLDSFGENWKWGEVNKQ